MSNATPQTITDVLKQAELILAAGWSQEDEKRRHRKVLGHSIIGAVYAVDALPELKNQTMIFLNRFCTDYVGTELCFGPERFDTAFMVRRINLRFPPNDGKRQALMLMGEAVDHAKELLGQ